MIFCSNFLIHQDEKKMQMRTLTFHKIPQNLENYQRDMMMMMMIFIFHTSQSFYLN